MEIDKETFLNVTGPGNSISGAIEAHTNHNIALFAATAGRDPVEALDDRKLGTLVEAGFLEIDATHLKATPAGQQRLNALLERLVA